MAELQGHGLAVSTPAGWEGRIYRRPSADELHGTSTAGPVSGAPAPSGELVHPVVHIATIPLAPDVADFASDAVDGLGPADAIVVLKEFDPSETAYVLFSAQGLPRDLDPDWFDPSGLQRTIPGQAGLQLFFQEGGRAFCVYVVLGSFARRNDVVPKVNEVLATIRIDPLGAPAPGPGATSRDPSSRGPSSRRPSSRRPSSRSAGSRAHDTRAHDDHRPRPGHDHDRHAPAPVPTPDGPVTA